MKAILLAYVIQAAKLGMLISSKAQASDVLPSGARRPSPYLEMAEAGGWPFFMMCLFGILGMIRSAMEFNEGGNKRLGFIGLAVGAVLVAGMIYVRQSP